jgi:hypothetical protein
MAVIRYARRQGTKWPWLARLLGRSLVNGAAVALAKQDCTRGLGYDGAWRAVQIAKAAVSSIGVDG